MLLFVVLMRLCTAIGGNNMATSNPALRAAIVRTAAILLISFVAKVDAQRFVDPGFRSYPLKAAAPESVEDSLRRFLADRIGGGEAIDIVSDQRTGRLLVRGSDEIQRLVDQFIQAVDIPANHGPIAQGARNVRGYPTLDDNDLARRAQALRERYRGRPDVRVAADSRTQQIVVHAPEDVHQQLTANWNNPQFFQPVRSAPPVQPARVQPLSEIPGQSSGPTTSQQVRLQHIDWQALLKGLRNVQGPNAAVTSPQNGTLEMMLASRSGTPTQLRIDQQNHLVQISGSSGDAQQWTRVIQALDRQPERPGELQAMGRLGDAQPTTITRTITMLGGAGAQQALRPLGPQTAQWGGDVVQRMFDQRTQQPLQLAQADTGAPVEAIGEGDDVARMLLAEDGAGSFLGPVRIEFLEGTDIFIVRGQKRDVDRVMKIINDIERLTLDTEPAVEVVPLAHANSAAVASLINQLNANVLQARQGDVSVTALVKPNALLLIGRPKGVEAVRKIVEKLDVETESTDQFEVYHLVYLPAVDAERTINNLYNLAQQQQTTEETTDLAPRVRAVADFRSNSLVVQGSPRDIREIGDLLAKIDVEGSGAIAEVQVFPLKNAIAEEVAEVLNETLGTNQSQQANQGAFQQNQQGTGGVVNTQPRSSNRAMMLQMKVLDEKTKKLLDDETIQSGVLANVVVTFNERTNSVVVTAPKGSMELIAEIIRQIDGLATQEALVRVFPVVYGDASTLITMLDALFPQDEDQDGPAVQSAAGTGDNTLVPLRFALEPRTNSVIATGNESDLQVIEAILLKLDGQDVSGRKTFVYELLNQRASAVADAITAYVLQRRQAITDIAPDTLSPYQLIDQEVVVVAEDNSNKVIVSVTERFEAEVRQLLLDLDKRPDMVMVKCLIAEVALNSTEEMGVELGIQDSLLFNRSVIDADGTATPGFNFNNQALGNNVSALGAARDQVAGQALSTFGLGRTNSELGYGGLVLSASNESVSILLRALQEARRLDILSRPQVMMLNNTEGQVQVGATVPFIQGTNNTAFGTTNTVQFIDVGLILSVLPRISPDGLVVMEVLADKSELGSIEDGIPISIGANGEVLRQPQINRTRASTFVSARDGQTVILGGLITKQRSAFERKVPYLADVPFFGRLFRTDGIAEERTELLIILTPYIIRNEADINRVNSEEYARMSWCMGNVIETHGDIGPTGEFGMMEGEVIYSEIGKDGSVLHPAPMDSRGMPDSETEGTSAPGDGVLPDPRLSNPPLPDGDADVLPQATRPESLLSPPRSAALDGSNNKGLFGRFSYGKKSSEAVRPVIHVDRSDENPEESAVKPAIYRLNEIPQGD